MTTTTLTSTSSPDADGEAVFNKVGRNSFVSKKWPIWFVPNWISWPCGVVTAASAMTPAFSTRISSRVLFCRNVSAACRIDGNEVRSSWTNCMSTASAAAEPAPFAANSSCLID